MTKALHVEDPEREQTALTPLPDTAPETVSGPGQGDQRGLQPSSSATSAASAAQINDPYDLKFQILVNANYQASREAWLNFVGRSFSAVSVICGSAALYLLSGGTSTTSGSIAALIVTVAGTLNLVLAPTQLARDHRDLKRRYMDLYSEMIGEGSPSAAEASKNFFKIAADAPPVYHAARASAYNTVVNGLYQEEHAKKYRLNLERRHLWFGHIFRFAGATFSPRQEHEGETRRTCSSANAESTLPTTGGT